MKLPRVILMAFTVFIPLNSLYALGSEQESTVDTVKEKTLSLFEEAKNKTIDLTKKLVDESEEIASDAIDITKEKTLDITKKIMTESGEVAGDIAEKAQQSGKTVLKEIEKRIKGQDTQEGSHCNQEKDCESQNEDVAGSI